MNVRQSYIFNNSSFARFARAFFIFVHFATRSPSFHDVK